MFDTEIKQTEPITKLVLKCNGCRKKNLLKSGGKKYNSLKENSKLKSCFNSHYILAYHFYLSINHIKSMI